MTLELMDVRDAAMEQPTEPAQVMVRDATPRQQGNWCWGGADHVAAETTKELTGCWINICPLPGLVWWSCYRVTAADDDALNFCAVAGIFCGIPLPVDGNVYAANFNDGNYLSLDKKAGAMAAKTFIVKSKNRMVSDTGATCHRIV